MKCDMCGNTEYIAGVCCSSLGAVSFCYCTICLAMGAEPKGLMEEMYDKEIGGVYYKDGSYYELWTDKLVPIKLKCGMEYNTREEVVKIWDGKPKVKDE